MSKGGDAGQTRSWRVRCRDVLRGMRGRGMFMDPPIVKLLNQLERTL